MKKYLFSTLALLSLTFGCSNQSNTPKDSVPPIISNVPTVSEQAANANADGDETVCSMTVFNDKETCFQVRGGGIGTIVIRDIMKTGIFFVYYTATEGHDPNSDKPAICFDLWDTADLSIPPFKSVCYEWDNYSDVIVATAVDGKMELQLVKK